MLKAGVFDDFKGATTLLLWGDSEGMSALLRGFNELRGGDSIDFVIDGPRGGVAVVEGGKLNVGQQRRRSTLAMFA